MDEMHAALDRLEARIDYQTGRIDALYELLELRGVLPQSNGTACRPARDPSAVWKQQSKSARRRPTRFHVGEATGV